MRTVRHVGASVVLVAATSGMLLAQNPPVVGPAPPTPEEQARMDLLGALRALDITTLDGCKAAVVRIEDPTAREIWRDTGIASQVAEILASARARLELARSPTATLSVHEAARRYRVAHPDQPRTVLARYADAEAEMLARLLAARRQATNLDARAGDDPDRAPAAARARSMLDLLQRRYQELIAESDALCAVAFVPAAMEQATWVELLAPDAKWRALAPARVALRSEGGGLTLQVRDGDGDAVLQFSAGEDWRDLVVDCTAEVRSGAARLEFRQVAAGDSGFALELPGGPEAAAPGRPGCDVAIAVVGSTARVVQRGAELKPVASQLAWDRPRQGAFALVVRGAAEIRFTRLRVRVLR